MTHARKKIRFPLITTKPFSDLRIMISLLPIWWILGVEQFIWAIFLFWILLKLIIIRKFGLKFPTLAIVFLVFLIFQFLSALVSIPFNMGAVWLAFFRNYSVMISSLLVLLVVTNLSLDWNQTKIILRNILFVMGFTALIGLLAILGLFRTQFSPLISQIIPDFINRADANEIFANRDLGHMAYFLGIRYFRLRTVFRFSTLYAATLISIIPFSLYYYKIGRNDDSKIIGLAILFLLVGNLLFTTARAAILSLVVGFVIFYLIANRKRKILNSILIIFLIILFLFYVLFIDSDLESLKSFFQFRSTESRFDVYFYTLKYWLQRPILGWGTGRYMSELPLNLSLGSHSYHFAILFRFGMIGFFIFVIMICLIWSYIRPFRKKFHNNQDLNDMQDLLNYGGWALVATIFDGLATNPMTDMSTMVIIWLIYSLLFITRKQLLTKVKSEVRNEKIL